MDMMSGIFSVISAILFVALMVVATVFLPVLFYFFVYAVWLLAVLGVPLLMVMGLVWLIGLPSSIRARRNDRYHSRGTLDVNRGLAHMENRLDNLEVLMFDRRMR